MARQALKTPDLPWKDVFVVPDLENFFSDHIDKLSRYAKKHWTQLQFIVELVDGDVQTSYRAFASDKVYEIMSKENYVSVKGDDQHVLDALGTRLYDMVPMETTINTYVLSKKTVLVRNESGTLTIPHGNIEPGEFTKETVDPNSNVRYVHLISSYSLFI